MIFFFAALLKALRGVVIAEIRGGGSGRMIKSKRGG